MRAKTDVLLSKNHAKTDDSLIENRAKTDERFFSTGNNETSVFDG